MNDDQRPFVSVGHIALSTDRMQASAAFVKALGMRPVFEGPEVSVFELRGGTHLLLMHRDEVRAGDASFDVMVDDIRAAHARYASLGLSPSPIEAKPAIDHELFYVTDPVGHRITVFSSHASGAPI